MERCLKAGQWGGYAGGDAPGVKFENCYWCQDKEIAGICSDTWGVEVRPNETKEANQPWHWVVIPAMGLTMGEIFYLKELAEDCAADKTYEFFFCAPPLDHHRRHRLAHQPAWRSNESPLPVMRGEAESRRKARPGEGRVRKSLMLKRPLTLASLALRTRRKALSPQAGRGE